MMPSERLLKGTGKGVSRIIIIGAGIAGLSAGIYARRNAYDMKGRRGVG